MWGHRTWSTLVQWCRWWWYPGTKSLLPDTWTNVNSLFHGKFEWNFRYVIFKQILVIDGWGISCEIALIWMLLYFTDDQSTLVQAMAWCRQAASHYLSQCWPRSLSPYGVTRPQWVNFIFEALWLSPSKFQKKTLKISLFKLLVKFKYDWKIIHFKSQPHLPGSTLIQRVVSSWPETIHVYLPVNCLNRPVSQYFFP